MADIAEIIRNAATQNGVPVEVLMRKAQIESSMNPNAYNKGSGASGLFQFIPSTWRQYGNGQDPFDPVANANAAAAFTKDNINSFKTRMGRDPSAGEIYLMHQQGAKGAMDLLSAGDNPASSVVPLKHITSNGGTPDMTAAQFANMWLGKFGGQNPTTVPNASPTAAPLSLAGVTPQTSTPTDDDQMIAVSRMFGSLTPEPEEIVNPALPKLRPVKMPPRAPIKRIS